MYFRNHPPQKSPKTLLFLDAGTALDHIEINDLFYILKQVSFDASFISSKVRQ